MDGKYVINIGRQFGSGGYTIALHLAGRLGIKFFDKELLALAAKESGFQESLFEKKDEKKSLFDFICSVHTVFDGGHAVYGNCLSDESLFKIQSDVIVDQAAKQSCLFVGRCADYILRDNPRCVNVFISADPEDRVKRICERLGIDEAAAHKAIEKADEQRSSYYNYYSCNTWGAAATYHLCINSSKMGLEKTEDIIIEFVKGTLHLEK